MMRAEDIREVVDCLVQAGISVWLDGGWGVDALLGEQTRPHDDLDLVVAADDDARMCIALAPLGFMEYVDERPTRVGLRAPDDRRIDVHRVAFDHEGGGIQQQPDGTTFRYPPEGFAGVGSVSGVTMRCLTPESQLLCHLAYEPDDDDRHDMRLLCARFGLVAPPPY